MYLEALKRQKTAFLLVLVFSGLVNTLMLTGSVYMLQVYDRVLSSGSVPTLVGLFTIVVVLYMFFGLFDFLRHRLLSRIALRLDASFGSNTFAAWIGSSLGSGNSKDAVQPIRQLAILRQFISSPTATSLFDLPFVPIFLGAMFLIHFWLGVMVVAGAVIAGAIALLGRLLTQKLQRDSIALEANLQEFSEHSHKNSETIVAMGMQNNITAHWQHKQMSSLATHQRISNPSEFLASASKTFRLLLQSAILTVSAFLVLQSQISAGMIIASSILSGRALAPIDQIIGQWRAIGRAASAHRALRTFFSDQNASATYVDLPAPTGRITLNGLTKFAPQNTGKNQAALLTNIKFDLEPGDGLGVIGNSASGKSSLARILVGAWRPDRGEMRLDGATLDQWNPVILGKSIGYLPQKVELLPGTISENIARFAPGADDKDVIAAARLAGIHDMILGLSEGYKTRVGGQSGTPLSGGQIQRLGLACAVFGMPSIVVLDEPNANLDATGDDALGEAITTLRKAGTTVIVMAHRPSAISAVNKIMVLHEGRVVRFDTKENVLGPPKAVQPSGKVTPLPVRSEAPQAAGDASAAAMVSGTAAIRVAAQDGARLESTNLAKILKAERQRQIENPEMFKEMFEVS